MKFLICLLPILVMAGAEDAPADNQRDLLAATNNLFSARMFNEVAKNEQGKSVVMSGFSALSPLAQLGLAAVGESHEEILKNIGLPNDEVIKSTFSVMNSNLRSVKGVQLKVANKVYIPEGHELNETFAKISREAFGSDVQNVNFIENQKAAATINGWVEDNTNHLIKDLVDPNSLGSDTRAVLVNAIYFKGMWADKFDKISTKDRDFHVSKEKTIKVPTMFKNGNFKYAESKDLDAKLLELPYEGGETSLLVVLPNEIDGIQALQQKLLDPTILSRATTDMYETEVDVYLPKFKIETTINLKDVLQKMGIKKLFGPDARLDYILKSEGDLYVSDAIQKAFIEVNEEGTEAAAASGFILEDRSGKFYPPVPLFKADRPFYFELKQNSAELFVGVVVQLEPATQT